MKRIVLQPDHSVASTVSHERSVTTLIAWVQSETANFIRDRGGGI
jgi:hypothetical protein